MFSTVKFVGRQVVVVFAHGSEAAAFHHAQQTLGECAVMRGNEVWATFESGRRTDI